MPQITCQNTDQRVTKLGWFVIFRLVSWFSWMLLKQGQPPSHRIHRCFWSWNKSSNMHRHSIRKQQIICQVCKRKAFKKRARATLINISIKSKAATFNCSVTHKHFDVLARAFWSYTKYKQYKTSQVQSNKKRTRSNSKNSLWSCDNLKMIDTSSENRQLTKREQRSLIEYPTETLDQWYPGQEEQEWDTMVSSPMNSRAWSLQPFIFIKAWYIFYL